MDIFARIENIKYNPLNCSKLKTFQVEDILSGDAFGSGSFILQRNGEQIAISQWVSPKRTRSYPYARVYDTYKHHNRVTIIPFLKDEGKDGDRDYIQWDTVSLMSLLGVYVILAYYTSAETNPTYENKITNQEFDYSYILSRLEELQEYKSDALHWNLNELDNNLLKIANKAKESYLKISQQTGVSLHSTEGIDRRIGVIKEDIESFKKYSRELALSAQKREFLTTQPKESLIEEKAKITIENYLGGAYYLTVDEAVLKEINLFLVEKKHTSSSIMPTLGDIKDGFIKMVLFTNLEKIHIGENYVNHYPVLGLTSKKFKGYCSNHSTADEIEECLEENNFSTRRKGRVSKIFKEGLKNSFLVFLANDAFSSQSVIFEEYLTKLQS